MNAGLILDVPLRLLVPPARRRIIAMQATPAKTGLPPTIRAAIDRETASLLKEIAELPDRAGSLARAEFKAMRKRMLAEIALVDENVTRRDAAAFGATWLAEMRRFAAEVERRQKLLEGDAEELGVRLGTAPARALGLDVTPVPRGERVDSSGYWAGLVDTYGEKGRAKIEGIVDSVRAGAMSVLRGRMALANEIDRPEHRAETIIRTEIGRVVQATAHDQLLALDEHTEGLAKRWVTAEDWRTREGHLEAEGQTVGIREDFLVRPKKGERFERLRYPKDPRGSAGNVANCRCSLASDVERVSIRPSRYV